MPLPAIPRPDDCHGVQIPAETEEQAGRLAERCAKVLTDHYKGSGISICAGSASEDAIKMVAKHFRAAGWEVKRFRDGGEAMLRFSRAK